MKKFYFVYYLSATFLILMYYTYLNIEMENYTNKYVGPGNNKDIKYILQWTARWMAPFDFLETGNSAFTRNKCKFTNCFVTDDRNYLGDIRNFDSVIFNGRDVVAMSERQLPKARDPRQKYIFGAMEPAHYFPACNEVLDGYFNWTWTYRLDSDFRWGYITIYDLNGNVVGPPVDMTWPKMKPVDEKLKIKLQSKKKAAAWFVSNCRSLSKRERFARKLKKELQKYERELDIYGSCGEYNCPKNMKSKCLTLLESDYFFYLSFENSFSKDYVTEKLLNALNYYAVPVVFGGANYSRFLPPGSYLDARELGVAKLAKYMDEIITNRSLYWEFHRWRNHYVYKEIFASGDLCTLCEMLNNEEKMTQLSVHKNFRNWWNDKPLKEACLSITNFLFG